MKHLLTILALCLAVCAHATTWFEHFATETLLWNPYLVLAINMLLNLITEFLFQRFVVYKDQIDQR